MHGLRTSQNPFHFAKAHHDRCWPVRGLQALHQGLPADAILPIATAEEKEKYKAIKKAQAEKAAAAKAAETAGAAQ